MLTLFNFFLQMTSDFPLALLLCLSSGLLTAYGAPSCPPGWTQFGSRCFNFNIETKTLTDAEGEPPCPPNWTQFGSRCFALYIQAKTWIDAQTFCQTAGGHLASIHSDAENTFLRDFINQVTGTYKNAWIGATDAVKEGTWLWTDGSKFDYKIFNAGQPDNASGVENCLEMNYEGKNWNDRPCSTYQASFVCSKNLYV
ncbi:galactose-specific lectin nattectin-like [Perca fluviatilis]|uniref:galactose-specific lectin nattectin-like n=1 Tax=Perca fluviatilis TaxID=8168 RepID=UPI001963C314|nr:galactose-specific lectin nattectin-like [Perca fluviatilis]